MITNHAIQATDLIPRTPTAQMPAAPARLPATPLAISRPQYPPARQLEEFDREYLLEVAAAGMHNGYDLTFSRDHVEAICRELHEVHDELLAARDSQQSLTTDLEVANDLRTAALADANDLRALSGQLSAQMAQLRIASALSTFAMTMAMTAPQLGAVADQLASDALADRADRARRATNATGRALAVTAQIVQMSRVEIAYRSSSPWFDVSDTDVVEEPTPGRSQTERLSMADVIAASAAGGAR